eukprot:1153432-Pelagomonas_calceolata.AAC.3
MALTLVPPGLSHQDQAVAAEASYKLHACKLTSCRRDCHGPPGEGSMGGSMQAHFVKEPGTQAHTTVYTSSTGVHKGKLTFPLNACWSMHAQLLQ